MTPQHVFTVMAPCIFFAGLSAVGEVFREITVNKRNVRDGLRQVFGEPDELSAATELDERPS